MYLKQKKNISDKMNIVPAFYLQNRIVARPRIVDVFHYYHIRNHKRHSNFRMTYNLVDNLNANLETIIKYISTNKSINTFKIDEKQTRGFCLLMENRIVFFRVY